MCRTQHGLWHTAGSPYVLAFISQNPGAGRELGSSEKGRIMGSAIHCIEFKSSLCLLLTLYPWARNITSLRLSFVISKMERTLFICHGCYEAEMS